jgi:TIR domain-containing protein
VKIKNWIFLSYARGDVHKVRDLYEKLYHAGFNPWLDKIHLLPGERWQDTVPKRIRGAKLVLLCLSKYSVNKTGYFWREIRMALDIAQEKPPSEFYLIPVRLEDCDIPDDLRNFHSADLFEETVG